MRKEQLPEALRIVCHTFRFYPSKPCAVEFVRLVDESHDAGFTNPMIEEYMEIELGELAPLLIDAKELIEDIKEVSEREAPDSQVVQVFMDAE